MISFDRSCARLLLEICRYTYQAGFRNSSPSGEEAILNDVFKRAGCPCAPQSISRGATSVACIFPFPDRNIVAYMGTRTRFDCLPNALASFEDWENNFDCPLVPFSLTSDQLGGCPAGIDSGNLGGLVHEGFLHELQTVQADVVDTLFRNGGKSRPVYITGHSQGGAEAALATRALLTGGFPVVATYTFAAPRPGDQDFTRTIPSTLPVFRIEFGDDLVPHLPPTVLDASEVTLADFLRQLPGLPEDARRFMGAITGSDFCTGLGKLCYGSNKTRTLRVGLSREQEKALFPDRLWSLVRHPEHWAAHHFLEGTPEETARGSRGNYTALVSDFALSD